MAETRADKKTVLITGASGGLGRLVSRRFLKSGSRVIAVGRSHDAEEGCETIVADLRKTGAARSVVRQVIEKTGRIDAVAHLVGGFAGGQAVHDAEDDVWEKMLELNLTMSYRVFRAALPPMLEAGRGRIVAVGSRAGTQASPGLAPYCASKAAMHMLVECTAAEVKHSGVTVNAVLPGVIDTPGNRAAMPEVDPAEWVKPERIAAVIEWIALEAPVDLNGALVPVYGHS